MPNTYKLQAVVDVQWGVYFTLFISQKNSQFDICPNGSKTENVTVNALQVALSIDKNI